MCSFTCSKDRTLNFEQSEVNKQVKEGSEQAEGDIVLK